MNFQVDSVLILTFIALFFLFYIISQHKGVEKKTIQKDKDIVRPSYGDEFYNYSGGDRILFKKEKINTQEEDVYKETELIEGLETCHYSPQIQFINPSPILGVMMLG